MNRKYVYYIFGLSVLSLLLVLYFFMGKTPEQAEAQDIQVETPPFLNYISGSGTVEPASGNILISSPLNRMVEKVYYPVNYHVKKGDVLVQLYNQDLQANLKIRQKKYEESLSNLYKLEALPRTEDLLIAQENLNKEQAAFNLASLEYCRSMKCAKCRADKCILFYKYAQAEAEFMAAQAHFQKIQSGAWQPDIKIAQDEVEQAKAMVDAAEAELEQTYIKAPIDGTILQMKIREGEILDQNKAAIILGNIHALNLRVSMDQFNQQRFQPTCPAVAFKQGDNTTEFPLKFLHIEPYMVPKKYLTNELQEKVDTQTFEILYRIENNNCHLFIGEQMDVYIYVDKNNQAN